MLFSLSNESPMSELSLELILLQVILPAVLEQGHTRAFVKGVIRQWMIVVATLLALHSYLLGKKSPRVSDCLFDGSVEHSNIPTKTIQTKH